MKLLKNTILNYIVILKLQFWNILEQQHIQTDYKVM